MKTYNPRLINLVLAGALAFGAGNAMMRTALAEPARYAQEASHPRYLISIPDPNDSFVLYGELTPGKETSLESLGVMDSELLTEWTPQMQNLKFEKFKEQGEEMIAFYQGSEMVWGVRDSFAKNAGLDVVLEKSYFLDNQQFIQGVSNVAEIDQTYAVIDHMVSRFKSSYYDPKIQKSWDDYKAKH